MNNKTKKMLVLGGERKSCLVVIRELSENGYHVTIGNEKHICLGFFTRYADRRIITPAVKDKEAYMDFVFKELQSNNYEMIYSTGGDITNLLSLHQEELSRYVRILVPNYNAIKKAGSKIETMKAAAEAGIPIPKTYFPTVSDIEDLSGEIEYPVLIKPSEGTGARGITNIASPEELCHKFPVIERQFGTSFVQELIPQPHDQYKADLLCDTYGNIVSQIVYMKHRYYPAEGGSSVLCRSVQFPEVLEHARSILKHMNWVGFADFDFIYDPRRNSPVLIEINPRFPESYGVGNASGINFSLLMYLIACGEDVPPQESYRLDQYFRFMPGDLLWFLTSPDRFRAKPSFFDFFNCSLHYQILSYRDPGPILAYIIENIRLMLKSENRKERFKLSRA